MPSVASISQQIWDMKYRLKGPDGAALDKTIEESWRRIATALAAPEKEPELWAGRFYEALENFHFLPAGRVVAGAGSGRNVTLFNCFVMGAIPDDMAGIFTHLREAALTMQQGGGIGYDFSTLRPRGAPVKGVGADASGPLSFMDVWDAMCRTIMSAGYRRGAMMATLRCDHPDIEAFIEAKREPGRLRMFNLSVLVTDAFMQAVEEGAPWELSFGGPGQTKTVGKVLPARELWDKIMRATYAYAEPGVIFIDRINRRNNLWYCEDIRATNPCGEQPLPPYGACLLGSLNLARFVDNPFTPEARLDTQALAGLVPDVVRMMDNIIDISRFPLPAQQEEAEKKRRIGLGVTGLADALMLCGIRYGSAQAVAAVEEWLGAIQRAAYLASADLARCLCRRADLVVAGRPCGHAGGGAAAYRQLDLEDHQCAGRDPVRAVQGHLRPRLRARLQGLHDLPAERGHRRRLGGAARGKAGADAGARPAHTGRAAIARPRCGAATGRCV